MAVIEVEHLTKRFGKTLAVDDLSFSIEKGTITGMLGPNGAGKTTTLRVVVDLVRATSGTTRILGGDYRALDHPPRRVGTLLDAAGFHPGRSGRNALRVLARQSGIDDARVAWALDMVGLAGDGKRRVKGYSTGMKARLALAGALLGDPEVAAARRARQRPRSRRHRLAARVPAPPRRARAAPCWSRVTCWPRSNRRSTTCVIMHRGRLMASGPITELARGLTARVWVRSPDAAALHGLFADREIPAQDQGEWLVVQGPTCEEVGRMAFAAGLVLSGLYDERPNLEQLFFTLTQTEVRPT